VSSRTVTIELLWRISLVSDLKVINQAELITFNPNPNNPFQGVKLKGYYPYFGVQPFTFPSKYFATFKKEGEFFCKPFKMNGKKKVTGP
jgi:hypothetical protein